MEIIPSRNMNPPEYPDAPRCGTCDAEMVDEHVTAWMPHNWVCHNPFCDDCTFSTDAQVNELQAEWKRLAAEVKLLRAQLAIIHNQQAAYTDPAPVRDEAVRPEVKNQIIAWLQCAPQDLATLDTRCWKDFDAKTFEVVQAIGQIRAEWHLVDVDGVYHLGDKRP